IGAVRVVETQESGNPHLHVLLLGQINFIPAEWLRELWEKHYGLGTFVNVKQIENTKGAIRYLLKYLVKNLMRDPYDSIQINQTQALLWADNRRQYAVSKALLYLITKGLTQTAKNSEWICLGAFYFTYIQDLTIWQFLDMVKRRT
ncbi:MAG: hypothetical protein QW478_07160, partial [Candidatus Micrarchaeaceae archaeon]